MAAPLSKAPPSERRLASQQVGLPEPLPASRAASTADRARLARRAGTMIRREATFRRLLALADAVAIMAAVLCAALIVGDSALQPAAAAIPFAFILLLKGAGLYDRDEHLLHKTTLDEIPRLFAASTATVMLLFLANGALIEGVMTRGQIATAWVMLLALLVLLRAIARAVALRTTAAERVLYVGDPLSAADFREKL